MRRKATCLVIGCAIAILGCFPAAASSAVAQFQTLQHSLMQDRAQKDWRAYLADAQRMRAFLNDSPLSNLEVARAELQVGDAKAAAAATGRFLAMGQVNAILSSPVFAQIRLGLEDAVKANEAAVSHARQAFAFSDRGLLPEDIDYDATSRRFFVTSILQKKIVTLDANGTQRDFAVSPDKWPMVAIKVDSGRRILWATEAAFDGFAIVPKRDWGRSVLLEYDLDRGALIARIEGPLHSNLGDMALAENGDPIVSDGDGGGIYRVHGRALTRIDHGDFVSPQTLAVCPHSAFAYMPDYVRGLATINLATGAVRWLSTQGLYDLDGIDGLYCRGDMLIAAQNGAAPERVVAFERDGAGSKIIAQHLIERAGALGDPTHGVFVGRAFYFIANSGWNSLDEQGRVKPDAPLTPARIVRLDLSQIAQ